MKAIKEKGLWERVNFLNETTGMSDFLSSSSRNDPVSAPQPTTTSKPASLRPRAREATTVCAPPISPLVTMMRIRDMGISIQ